ncbi:MAG: efflux RND transporter periplasmic adaptor subunit [Desulfobacteraceae bacterium]
METKRMESSQTPEMGIGPIGKPLGVASGWILLLLCFAAIGIGVVGYLMMIKSAPNVRKRPPVKMVPLVTVQKIYPATQQVAIKAMGTVVPAKELTLKSRVSGEIVRIHPQFTEGGIIRKGEQILQIDELDYKLIAAQKESAVADASYALKLELGRQDVAKREWKLLNGDNPAPEADAELALRKPHLEKAQSDLTAAQAELEAARLQLARTKIIAPFNAVIRSRKVEKGSMIAVQENLATLVGTDDYWVQVSIPIDRLRWVDIPDYRREIGAEARILYHGGAVRSGRVVKLLSDLEEQGRMARVVVAVKDPLGMQPSGANFPAMLIGEYVRVEIQGHEIKEAFRIPRSALRDNTHIWLVDPEGKLEIRKVRTLWRDNQAVLIKDGLKPGAQLVVSDLATPVPGMAVKVDGSETGSMESASTAEK